MSIVRRHLLRLLRVRNLLLLTAIVILLYIAKILGNVEMSESILSPVQDALQGPNNKDTEKNYFVPSSLKKVDWHNYTQINAERKRVGLGEQGRPAELPASDGALVEKLYAVNGFNGALSDKIPLNRSLPDIRHPGCKNRMYIESLPTVSVVVPFHNEHWSTLLRTAYSVLHRSPKQLIKEVFLVDDASTKDFLKDKLDTYLAKNMPKVKVVRLAQRSGLITARLAGARLARADVLVFLDSHTEANVNWLPPLLEPIALQHRTVSCPFIDVVDHSSLEYRAQDEGARGAFDWELFYKRLPLLPKDEAAMPDPFESPVMAGGLFAISRVFFWELGGYDPGLDIWGGEQYELSFKIWQCGGRMVDVPCSRVGHIYRKFAPFPNPGHGDFVGKNYRRVAEVWMDEYAEYVYQRRPHYRSIAPGDISQQRALRDALHCKPFKWFITQIAFDLPVKYPPVEPKPFAEGRIRPKDEPSLCIDAAGGRQMAPLQLRACGAADAEQEFLFTWHKDVKSKSRNMCWDLPESKPKSPVVLYSCHLGGGNQLWRYDPATGQLRHGHTDKCVEWEAQSQALFVQPCDPLRAAQRWAVGRVRAALMRTWDLQRPRVTGPGPYP